VLRVHVHLGLLVRDGDMKPPAYIFHGPEACELNEVGGDTVEALSYHNDFKRSMGREERQRL
jgi:hypothetical protein